MQAFIYGFPYIYNAKVRHEWVTSKQDPDVVPYAAVNQFWHARRLMDASYRAGGCPSTDSLYSLAWLDLSEQPIILSHPDMGGRYFTFQLAAFTSDNFGYVGQRTTGSGAGAFAIVGPGWDGELPLGVQRVRPSPTPWVLVLGRTAVNGSRICQTQPSCSASTGSPLSVRGARPGRRPRSDGTCMRRCR